MGILVVDLFITLDGVYQAPGGPDEDPSGGFGFGGWQAPYVDEESGAMIGAGIQRLDALLLGRGALPAAFRLAEQPVAFPKGAIALVYEGAGVPVTGVPIDD